MTPFTTNEVVIEKLSEFCWYGLGPDGGDVLGNWKRKSCYYFTDGHTRRKSMAFLRRDGEVCWEVLGPVEGTNCWVRVEGPGFPDKTETNIVITVFNPRRLLYQQKIAEIDPSKVGYLHLDEGNRIVTYKSEHDDFVYSVLDNSVQKTDRAK